MAFEPVVELTVAAEDAVLAGVEPVETDEAVFDETEEVFAVLNARDDDAKAGDAAEELCDCGVDGTVVVTEDVSVLTESVEEDETIELGELEGVELGELDGVEETIELGELEGDEGVELGVDEGVEEAAAVQVTVVELPLQETDSVGGIPPVRRAAFPDTETNPVVLLVAVHLTTTEIKETDVVVFSATSHSPVVLPETSSKGPLMDSVA